MAFPILIITPVRSFGELIRQALQEVGYQLVEILARGTTALDAMRQRTFALVILDFELSDVQPQAMIQLIREDWPTTHLIATSIDAACGSELASSLAACLPKPFYLPDLIDVVATLLPLQSGASPRPDALSPVSRSEKKSSPDAVTIPAWLQDVNLAAQYLTRLSLASTAQAALIARSDQIWAYAGQLSQSAAQELARLVGSYWIGDGGSDYVRFVHLESAASEYLLYATGLGGDFILALAFETEMPFSKIRAQAAELASKLSTAPITPPQVKPTPQPDAQPPGPAHEPWPVDSDEWLPEEDLPSGFPLNTAAGAVLPEGRQAFMEHLLATIDVPEPGQVQHLPAASRPAPEPQAGPLQPQIDSEPAHQPAETNANQAETRAQLAVLPAPVPVHHQLTYVGVMVPRLPDHLLVGRLPAILSEKLQQLCLAFDWRLEHLSLRPDHLQWVISAPPETSPAALMGVLRQQTSGLIFAEQPGLASENPSGDFWAAGYLLVNASQPLVHEVIQEFLYTIRHHQGLKPPQD
ncbi:MAG: transposase [Anaerolineales bacterium]|nr:transposase [Anaerolineales bacterium]